MFSKAFTLIEILIVIAIVGILLGMAYPEYQSLTRLAATSHCGANIRMIQTAKTTYAIDNLGKGSPDTSDAQAAFRSYFSSGFTGVDVCPITGLEYENIYNIYKKSTCPNPACNQ